MGASILFPHLKRGPALLPGTKPSPSVPRDWSDPFTDSSESLSPDHTRGCPLIHNRQPTSRGADMESSTPPVDASEIARAPSRLSASLVRSGTTSSFDPRLRQADRARARWQVPARRRQGSPARVCRDAEAGGVGKQLGLHGGSRRSQRLSQLSARSVDGVWRARESSKAGRRRSARLRHHQVAHRRK
jgi:hypothetical protein